MAKSKKDNSEKMYFTINGMNKRELPDAFVNKFSEYKEGDIVKPFLGGTEYRVESVKDNVVDLKMNYKLK